MQTPYPQEENLVGTHKSSWSRSVIAGAGIKLTSNGIKKSKFLLDMENSGKYLACEVQPIKQSDIRRLLTLIHNASLTHSDFKIKNAIFKSKISKQLITTHSGFTFENCIFRNTINFNYSKLNHLIFRNCIFCGGISLEQVEVANNLIFENCEIFNTTNMKAAHINGNFEMRATTMSVENIANVTKNPERLNMTVLDMDGVHIRGELNFSKYKGKGEKTKNTKIYGKVRFINGSVGRQALFGGAHLHNLRGKCLSAQGVAFGSDVMLNNGFEARGCIDFQGSTIKGQMSIRKAKLIGKNADEKWVNTDKTKIFKKPSFKETHEKYKPKITTLKTLLSFSFYKSILAYFLAHKHNIFDPKYIQVEKRYLNKYKTFEQEIPNLALSLRHCVIEQDCIFRELIQEPRGSIVLSHATLNQICDDRSFFPYTESINEEPYHYGFLYLNGLVYKSFSNRKAWKKKDLNMGGSKSQKSVNLLEDAEYRHKAEFRFDWLMCQRREYVTSNFLRQPWLQCAKVLNESAESKQAKRLVIMMERMYTQGLKEMRSEPGLVRSSIKFRTWRRKWLRGFLTNYGYSPIKPIRWLLLTFAIASLSFTLLHKYVPDLIVPTEMKYVTSAKYQSYNELTKVVITNYPKYNSMLYSLDSLIPVIDFGQKSNWGIRGNDKHFWLRLIVILFEIFLAFAGWALSTVFLLGLAQSTFKSFKPAY